MVPTSTESLHLRLGMKLAMELVQQVGQDARTHKLVQDGTLSSVQALYEWACQADDILRPPVVKARQ